MASPHAPVGAHGAEADHAATFPPFDASLFSHQLFWLVVSLLALYLALSRLVLPKIARTLEARRASIDGDLAAAEAANRAAQQERASYEAALNAAREETRRVLDAARAEAGAAQTAAQARSERALAEQLAQAEVRLAEQTSKGMAAIDAIARDVSRLIVAKLLGPTDPHASPAGGGTQ